MPSIYRGFFTAKEHAKELNCAGMLISESEVKRCLEDEAKNRTFRNKKVLKVEPSGHQDHYYFCGSIDDLKYMFPNSNYFKKRDPNTLNVRNINSDIVSGENVFRKYLSIHETGYAYHILLPTERGNFIKVYLFCCMAIMSLVTAFEKHVMDCVDKVVRDSRTVVGTSADRVLRKRKADDVENNINGEDDIIYNLASAFKTPNCSKDSYNRVEWLQESSDALLGFAKRLDFTATDIDKKKKASARTRNKDGKR